MTIFIFAHNLFPECCSVLLWIYFITLLKSCISGISLFVEHY